MMMQPPTDSILRRSSPAGITATEKLILTSSRMFQAARENGSGGLATQAFLKAAPRTPVRHFVRDLKIPGQIMSLNHSPVGEYFGCFEDVFAKVDAVIILAPPTADLPGVRVDAANIKQKFEGLGKKVFDEFTEDSTKEEVCDRMTALLDEHANVFVYVAGHGNNHFTQNPDEPTGHDTSLKFRDFDLSDNDLRTFLPNDHKQRFICMFFDTCNAEGFANDLMQRSFAAVEPAQPRGLGAEFMGRPAEASLWDSASAILTNDTSVASLVLGLWLVASLVRASAHTAKRGRNVVGFGVPLVVSLLGMFKMVEMSGDVKVLSALAGAVTLVVSMCYGLRGERLLSEENVVRMVRMGKLATEMNVILVSLLLYNGGDHVFMSVTAKDRRPLMFFPLKPTFLGSSQVVLRNRCLIPAEGNGVFELEESTSFTMVGKTWVATCNRTVFVEALKGMVGNDMSKIETFRVGNISMEVGKMQLEANSLMTPSTWNLQAPPDERVKALLRQLSQQGAQGIVNPALAPRGFFMDTLSYILNGVLGVFRSLVGA